MVNKKRGKKPVSKKIKTKSAPWTYYLSIVILALGIVGGIFGEELLDIIPDEVEPTLLFIPLEGENTAQIVVPAIDQEGNGVPTNLAVTVKEGTGKTLVDIDSLLFWVDTQNSIRKAKLVAQQQTNLDLDLYDITYKIDAQASLIGGESAGAALTIATIAALENKELRDDVVITGTVNHDGTIGPIGGVLEKAGAAKDIGLRRILVPLLQSKEVAYEEQEHCEQFGNMDWCTIERIPKAVDLAKETGIEIIEVSTISEAMEYFYVV
jgi:uncharacterized protein